jgi:uncharacterized protein (TIGR02466 family)
MTPDALVVEGLNALRAGDQVRARSVLTQALTVAPRHADALQLMGMLHKQAGRLHDAQDCLRKSLAVNPKQPNVLNNLANLLRGDDPAEARSLYRDALALKPDYVDAMIGLAGLDATGPDEAGLEAGFDMAAQAAALAPADPRPREILSLAALGLGRLGASAEAAREAVAIAGDRASSWHRLGDALLASDDHEGAAQAYATALRLDPMLDVSWAGYAASMRHLHREDQAEEASIRALSINPSNLVAHTVLNGLLWTQGRTAAHLGSYRHGIGLRPRDVPLKLALAGELVRTGGISEARALVDEALQMAPQIPAVLAADGRLAISEGRFERATQQLAAAAAQQPGAVSHVVALADAQLKADRAVAARETMLAALERFPDDQDVLARLALAFKFTGDDRYAWLCPLDDVTAAIDLPVPPGSTPDGFCAEVSAYLRTLHTARVHPLDQTLRHGTQTFGQLLADDPHPLIQTLGQLLQRAVTDFIGNLPRSREHPFLRRNTGRMRFSGSWSARLGPGGYHTSHIHPRGWISSACYLSLPPDVEDMDARSGWLAFGQSNMKLGSHDQPDRLVQPKVGRLVLFPSYVWHGTTPFMTGQERMTVAFDAVPVP